MARNIKYYDISNVLKTEAQYIILLGQRSNGKSYQAKLTVLKNAYETERKFVYLRRYKTELKQAMIKNGNPLFFKQIENDEELKHDGTLLQKAEVNNEDIKAKISFDIVITLESGVSFSGKITIENVLKIE